MGAEVVEWEQLPAALEWPDMIVSSVSSPEPVLSREMIERAGLKLTAVENFGDSYALTLREWRRRFLNAWPEIEKLGFGPSFKRLWVYYLCYCEAGFRSGAVDVGIYSLAHANRANRLALP